MFIVVHPHEHCIHPWNLDITIFDLCFDRKRPYYLGWLVVQNRGHSGSRSTRTILSCGWRSRFSRAVQGHPDGMVEVGS